MKPIALGILCAGLATSAAAQTYNGTPDGKRIQIAWGRIEQPGMPFNQMMLFPTELSLRTTNEGIRMFSEPIAAVAGLHAREHDLSGLDLAGANERLKCVTGDLLHVKARFESTNGGRIGLDYRGNRCVTLDADEINGIQVPMQNPGSLVFDVEMLIDRTSIEIYFQRGRVVIADPLKKPADDVGLQLAGDPASVRIDTLKVFELHSAWLSE